MDRPFVPPIHLPTARPSVPHAAALPLSGYTDALTPRFLELLDSEMDSEPASAAMSGNEQREGHLEDLRNVWQQALYRQSVLEADNERLKQVASERDAAAAVLEADNQRLRKELELAIERAAAAEASTAALPIQPVPAIPQEQWGVHAAAVQNVLGALPVYRPGAGGPSTSGGSSDWANSCGLSLNDVSAALYWIDSRLCHLMSLHFPKLSRLMSTPLLCRDSDLERAQDLLQKRDSLLLLRDGQHSTILTLKAPAQLPCLRCSLVHAAAALGYCCRSQPPPHCRHLAGQLDCPRCGALSRGARLLARSPRA